METNLPEAVRAKLKKPLEEYHKHFTNFLNAGKEIENALQSETDLLAEIRRKCDNLSATVELEFEGISVFDQEIKKAQELLQQGITKFNESVWVSSQINKSFSIIANIFDKIRNEGTELEEIIKNISLVSESIEVASRNAGITAFHAGKQGRGFEVIAREMTSLVRSSQKSAEAIPKVCREIIKSIGELKNDLNKITNIIDYLQNSATEFSQISKELLSFLPEIELDIKGISEGIASQKEMHRILLKENESFASRLDNIYDTARASAIIEILLAGLFHQINNIKEDLLAVKDNTSFYYLYNSFRNILSGVSQKGEKIISGLTMENFEKLETESLDPLMLQFVSEANHLSQTISRIGNALLRWLKANAMAAEMLPKALVFYQNIIDILGHLNKTAKTTKELIDRIDQPLGDLKKITERSRLLGLYAGIESARGGEYASSLGVVTKEIKGLSQKTSDFLLKIGELEKEMRKEFGQLGADLSRSMSYVEQGIESLKSAISYVEETEKVLQNLTNLSQEMLDSTTQMLEQCRIVGEKIRIFNDDYKKIKSNFKFYIETINSNTARAEDIYNVLSASEKEVSIIDKKTKRIVYRDNTDPIILDPANKTDATSHQIIEQIFIGLLSFDQAHHLIPAVSDIFSVSRDGRQWDFSIKKNVKFHNNTAVTARDVLNSMVRVQKGPNANFIDYVDDIVVIDDLHIRFLLKYPYIPFLATLACGVCDITPARFSADAPVGCGPYRLVSWEKNREIVLEVFDDFFDGRAPIDQAIIKIIPDDKEAVRLFKRGEISIMEVTAEMLKEFKPEEICTGPALSTQYIAINLSKDTPFKNRKVRQAMNYAIDKEYYTKVLMQGQAIPGYGIFPPGMASYNPQLMGYRFNLARAQILMREAGYSSGIDDSFTFDIREGEEIYKRAEFIKDALAKIGINLILKPQPWQELLERSYRGESLLSMRGWISDNGDPDNFLFPLFHSRSFGRPGNTSFYANKEVDRLIESARVERSTKQRLQMYRKLEEMIIEDAPWIFLAHGAHSYVLQPNIGGFKIDPFGLVRFRYLWVS